MNLIAKNKITSYIENHPEARVKLLIWLREFPYREGKMRPKTNEDSGNAAVSTGVCMPGLGEYAIRYLVNPDASIFCIIWVGSEEEFKALMLKEHNTLKQKDLDLFEVNVEIEVKLMPPPPRAFDFDEPENHNSKRLDTAPMGDELDDQQAIITTTEYQPILDRVISIFDSSPDSREFEEMLGLLPSIIRYEAFELKFPPVYAYEVAQQKINMFQMSPGDFATYIGYSEEEINRALGGDPDAPEELLIKLFKVLNVPFPVTDLLY